jgi:hypothetical protein
MLIQLLNPDGSVRRTLDTDSSLGTALHTALLEFYHDRVGAGTDPVYSVIVREACLSRADDAFQLLEAFFPGSTGRIH